MSILREYKSVVFWLIFVSLWIIGFDLSCNKEKNNKIKENGNTSGNNVNIKNNKNSNTNINNSSNKRDTNSENKKPNGYTNINNLNSKQNIHTVNNFVQNNSKVQNMNQIRINNNFNNNKQPVPAANTISDQNINNWNMNPPLKQNMAMMNNPMQNNNKVQNMNQIRINNPVYNNKQPVQAIYTVSDKNINNWNMNPPLKQNIPMMNNPMQNLINNNRMMNNHMQNNNNNLVYPQNQNQNQISYQGQIITQNPNQNPNVINIPPPSSPKKPGPISTYTKPTLIGLNNIGSTCYKNAVLQCLSQTKDLTNYFLNDNNYDKIIGNNIAKKNPGTKTLCPIYYNLIKNLWKKNATFKSFSPDEFMNSIGEMTKNDQTKFGLYEAGDAKDFIIYILERMHKELKQPIKNKFWKLGPNDKLNQYDKNNAFLHFLDEFQQDTSIVSELFYGFNETTNVCQFCKNKYNSNGQIEPICYNYGIFNILIFPLEEVRKYREQMMRMTNTNINIGATDNVVYLFECFFYNQKTDFFTAYGPNGIDNRQHCNICGQTYDSAYTTKIFVSPNILVLILNRGKGNVFNIKLDFPLQFDSTQFVLSRSQNKEKYNLYGVITHLGQSGPSGHFIASCKSPVDGNWYRYNDGIVNPIKNVKEDVIDYGTPYILF